MEPSFPNTVTNPGLSARFGLPAATQLIGPPIQGTILAKVPGAAEGRSRLLAYDGPWPPPRDVPRPQRPRPTAPVPHPPEIIPESSQAIAVCTSPDVCRSPSAPVPYMVWGKGDDDDNYSPDVFSNGQRIKRADSRFTATYGDEPGTGLGVKSGTVGNIVEPVTSSAIVRANGIPIQRHTDTCTLNNGNCPGEYIHVQSTETTPAPDGRDEGDQTPADVALGEAEKARKGFYENSSEAQAIVGAWNRAGDYIGDPSLIGQDLQRARDAIPTTDEVVQFGRDAATGAGNLAEYVAENPVQSAKNVWNWGVDGVTGLWNGVEGAYQEGGISQAGGHLAAAGLSLVNPFKKAKAVGEGVDALGDLGRVGRRRDGDEGNDGDGPDVPPRPTPDQNDDRRDETDGEDGARSTSLVPRRDLECFSKPEHLSEKEFERQLREQEAAINNSTADVLIARRDAIREAGGTSPLRDLTAQSNARAAYQADRIEALINEGKSAREAARITADELSNLAATHRLDIIAGGGSFGYFGYGRSTYKFITRGTMARTPR